MKRYVLVKLNDTVVIFVQVSGSFYETRRISKTRWHDSV